jgi:hypothetical protein
MSDPANFNFEYKFVSILHSITTLVIFWILTVLCMVTWHKSGGRCSDVTHGTQDERNCFNRDKTVIVVINANVTLKAPQFSFYSIYGDYINKINLQCNAN